MKPRYTAKAIGSIAALAAALRVNEVVLSRLAATASTEYDSFEIDKKTGGKRKIYSPKRLLKFVQKRINRAVFENIEYPDYLLGGLADRDYVKNAALHANAECLIALDVKDFYPSITREHVRSIYKFFCRFPDDVAEVLTNLSTRDGSVPQGACTSSYLANLVLYEHEHRIVKIFRDRGLRYSRLMDDISISSSRKKLGKAEVDFIFARVTAMLETRNLKLKKSKTAITSRSNPQDLMEVTGLWLNRGQPRVRRAERKALRSEVARTEKSFAVSRFDLDYHELFNSVSGKVAKLAHLGHAEAAPQRQRLRAILPHYDEYQRARIERQVNALWRSDKSKRGTFEYIHRYHAIKYQVNLMRRNDKARANALAQKLKGCTPTKSKEELTYG